MALAKYPCAFRLGSSHKTVSAEVSPAIFADKISLVKCPCAFPLRRLAQNETSHTEILPRGSLSRDLARRPLRDILSRGLAKRPLKEICAERALIELLYTDLARRPLMEILYRDLVKRVEVFLRDHL